MNRKELAEATGLEPATSAVTGQRSNQLSYASTRIRQKQNVSIGIFGTKSTRETAFAGFAFGNSTQRAKDDENENDDRSK